MRAVTMGGLKLPGPPGTASDATNGGWVVAGYSFLSSHDTASTSASDSLPPMAAIIAAIGFGGAAPGCAGVADGGEPGAAWTEEQRVVGASEWS